MPENKLIAKRIAFVPTLRCTLNCKLCCNFMPAFSDKYDVPVEKILADIDAAFQIFDRIEWVQFVGGEIFLHQQMSKVYEYLLRYRDRFDKLILMTNASIAPRPAEIAALKQYGDTCKIMISHYGKYSYQLEKFIAICQNEAIPYIVKAYTGDSQYCDGWIDNTLLQPFTGTAEALDKLFNSCPQVKMQNMHCLNGQLFMCSNSCFLAALGKAVPAAKDFIELHDQAISIAQKRAIAQNFYKQPANACAICAFKDMTTAKRFPAAEQI